MDWPAVTSALLLNGIIFLEGCVNAPVNIDESCVTLISYRDPFPAKALCLVSYRNHICSSE